MTTTIEDVHMDMEGEQQREQLIQRLLGEGRIQIVKPDDYESIDKRIEEAGARNRELENEALEKDIDLKEKAFNILWKFLAIETGAMFLLAILQGFSLGHFRLEEWSFKLLITATIGQITYMLQVAIKHLFPMKK